MNITIIFFQIQIVVLVLDHGLKEIEAVAIGQQTFQSQNRLFNHFLTRESTRGNVAFFGSFGYELDLSDSNPDELEEIKEQIAFYKQYRSAFQFGTFTRLLSPFEGEDAAWQVASKDGSQVIVGFFRRLVTAYLGLARLRLKGLDEQALYELDGKTYYGSDLMYAGLPIHNEVHVLRFYPCAG